MPTLTAVPRTFTAGDTVAVTLTFPDYPAPTWIGTLALAGASVVSVNSVANGAAHDFTLSATQTAALTAGDYRWRIRLTSGAVAETVQQGTLTVLADVGALTAGEGVSYWQTLKTAAEAALLTLMEGGAPQQVMIAGRMTMFRSPDDCLSIIAMCESRLQAAQSRTFGASILINAVGQR